MITTKIAHSSVEWRSFANSNVIDAVKYVLTNAREGLGTLRVKLNLPTPKGGGFQISSNLAVTNPPNHE
jgi:hypothetical protein